MNAAAPLTPQVLRRKRDQAWELAGLAHQDGDKADAERWTAKARELERLLAEASL